MKVYLLLRLSEDYGARYVSAIYATKESANAALAALPEEQREWCYIVEHEVLP